MLDVEMYCLVVLSKKLSLAKRLVIPALYCFLFTVVTAFFVGSGYFTIDGNFPLESILP